MRESRTYNPISHPEPGVTKTEKYGWVLNLPEEHVLASEARKMAAHLTQAANWLDYKNGGRRG